MIRPEWMLTELRRAEDLSTLRTILPRRLRELRADLALASARPVLAPSCAPQLLIVDSVYPDPTRDSGSDKIARISRMAASLGYRTIIASTLYRHWAVIEDTSVEDIDLPEPQAPWSPEMFWDWVQGSTAIWLERPDVAGRILPVLGRARTGRRVIFSTADLHHVRIAREAAISGRSGDRRLARTYYWLERALLGAADLTLAITPDEATILRYLDPSACVEIMPNVHETRQTPVPPRAGRRGLVFVGNYKHGPNVDAVRRLVDSIMPALWDTLPEAELTVIGDRLPADISDGADPRLHFPGWVEDIGPYIDGAVALTAPLRFGSGMKGKNGLAMANGLPVVTTSIGAEGMGLEDGRNALIADDDADYVERCVRVLTDDVLWFDLSQSGMERIRSTWSAQALLPTLRTILGG